MTETKDEIEILNFDIRNRDVCEAEQNIKQLCRTSTYEHICSLLKDYEHESKLPLEWYKIGPIPIPPFRRYKYNSQRTCAKCGNLADFAPGPIYHVSSRGKKRKILRGGFCNDHGIKRYILNIFKQEEFEIWFHKMEPEYGDDPWRKIFVFLLSWLPIPFYPIRDLWIDQRKLPNGKRVSPGRRYNRRKDRFNSEEKSNQSIGEEMIYLGQELIAAGKKLIED